MSHKLFHAFHNTGLISCSRCQHILYPLYQIKPRNQRFCLVPNVISFIFNIFFIFLLTNDGISVIILHVVALSPNGKALDSDSSIFQVRILVALLHKRTSPRRCPFLILGSKAPRAVRACTIRLWSLGPAKT